MTSTPQPPETSSSKTSGVSPYFDIKNVNVTFDPSISEEERNFYIKSYPNLELVRDRKVHCTTCKCHIGTAPNSESSIKMHPILRVTHCLKCHDFYNSGEFSKGEDGSELYCRWCGQGGEVYCCSNCPFVFCKSCIVKNLSRGVVADIEQNENWSCFNCAPKIIWPLRAHHWALVTYIALRKKEIASRNLPENELRAIMAKDNSTCCRLAKAKCGNMSDSVESIDSVGSKRSHNSSASLKRAQAKMSPQSPHPSSKRAKNDEVVCTPDLMSMLEPDCQLTVNQSKAAPMASTPKVMSIQQPNYSQQTGQRSNVPPPLVLRNTSIQMRPIAPAPVVRRTVVGPRTPAALVGNTPVYHTIGGYRIDLNSAAQQETFRLPNGKLIQVKRQGAQPVNSSPTNLNTYQRPAVSTPPMGVNRPVQITQVPSHNTFPAVNSHPTHPQVVRYQNTLSNNAQASAPQPQIHVINGNTTTPIGATAARPAANNAAPTTPVLVRHTFPPTPIGNARSQFQDRIFNVMEICTHLTSKIQMLTHSTAYKTARNYVEVKDLYIHLSYLLTFAMGRYKELQDKCLADMRSLGFVTDADNLSNGQLAAGIDYVRYGQLDDVDLFNTGSNSFHNQIYEYRKSLHANLENGENDNGEILPPPQLGVDDTLMDNTENDARKWPDDEESLLEPSRIEEAEEPAEIDDNDDMDDPMLDQFLDDGEIQDDTDDWRPSWSGEARRSHDSMMRSTEDVMRREEESHAYDRKLTRLIEQYPSIWCTKHPDYGNFEVTRKQWRTIASHFKRSESIKLRWKNIRKRFVRIERRIREGKRFNGYFDKATNFLANRDLPQSEWINVDSAEKDGDKFERKELDRIELALYPKKDENDEPNIQEGFSNHQPGKPVEIRTLDLRIINFVKCNPVLWRKSNDPAQRQADEHTRKSLWMHFWKSVPTIRCEEIVDRWNNLYEMYKTFRLKSIKDKKVLANLELKYSKYLAKLYFLYKIDEEELKNENVLNTFDDADFAKMKLEEDREIKLQDMPDDKEFVLELVRTIRQHPVLWNKRHLDYDNSDARDRYWDEVAKKLEEFKRDVNTIKLRWQLIKFSYKCLRRELRQSPSMDVSTLKYVKNLPIEDLAFLVDNY